MLRLIVIGLFVAVTLPAIFLMSMGRWLWIVVSTVAVFLWERHLDRPEGKGSGATRGSSAKRIEIETVSA